jgi:hypothetical protein
MVRRTLHHEDASTTSGDHPDPRDRHTHPPRVRLLIITDRLAVLFGENTISPQSTSAATAGGLGFAGHHGHFQNGETRRRAHERSGLLTRDDLPYLIHSSVGRAHFEVRAVPVRRHPTIRVAVGVSSHLKSP